MRALVLTLALVAATTLACSAETVTVEVPADTPTPQPTYTPYPTLQPLATLQALPTYTPHPTPEALPTYTPYPTLGPPPTAEPMVITESGGWIATEFSEGPLMFTVIGHHEAEGAIGPWWLSLGCYADGSPSAFLGTVWGVVYSGDTEDHDLTVIAEFDGMLSEQRWFYYAPTDEYGGQLVHARPDILIEQIIQSESVTLSVPASGRDYVVTFKISGLDQYITTAAEVCP